MKLKIFLAAALAASLAGPAMAADDPVAALRDRLTQLIPAQKPDSIEAAPVEGLYQVSYGAQVFYMTGDGRYVLEGNLVDLESRRNLTAEAQSGGRKAVLDTVDEDQMIVYKPKEVKHTITVFTDIDCPYCRKLHQEMDTYMDKGIEVRYMLFPRAGVGSPAYQKAVNVWCADDRNAALTKAKNGEAVKSEACDAPVSAQLDLGRQIGVSGTPAIVLEDGTMLPGYRPAVELAQLLDQHAAMAGVNP